MTRHGWATLLVALAVAGAARAEAPSVWEKAAGPGSAERRYAAAMREGDRLAARAAELVAVQEVNSGQLTALRAVAAYEKASRLQPHLAEPNLRAAEIIHEHYLSEQTTLPAHLPTERALKHWSEFLRKAPRDPRVANVLFRRSLTYTKLGGEDGYRRSIADYETLLGLTASGSIAEEDMATYLSNAAEIHMALGEIDRAIEEYDASLAYASQYTTVHAYGLAVALDRDGQGERARELMSTYRYNHEVLFPAAGQTFFFVPEGDVYWYQALGMETHGKYESAVNFYRRFLEAQPRSPYAARAREHLKRLEPLARKERAAARQPRPEPYLRTWLVP